MKRIYLLILLSFGLLCSQAQYQKNESYGTQNKRGSFDTTLFIPTGCGVPSGTASLKSVNRKQAAKYFDSCGGKSYTFNPKDSTWTADGVFFDTTYMNNRINTKLSISDTGAMLAPRWLGNRIADSLAAIQSRIETKQPLGSYLVAGNNLADVTNITTARSNIGLGNVPNVDATNASNISSGTLADARLSGNVTVQGNSFNGANQLVKTGSDGKLLPGVIPALALVDTYTPASQAAMLALPAEQGDIAIRTDINVAYILYQAPATTLGNWIALPAPSSETDPLYTASSWYSTTNNSSNWNTAFSWGNHAGLYLPVTGGSINGQLRIGNYRFISGSGIYDTTNSEIGFGSTSTALVANAVTKYNGAAGTVITYISGSEKFRVASSLITAGTDLSLSGRLLQTTSTSPTAQGQQGYNSSIGWYLYPKAGSSYDWNFYNSGGFAVMYNPTGTTNVEVAGNFSAGAISGTSFTAGSAYMLPWVTDATFARFGHSSKNTATNYGFLQDASGNAYIQGTSVFIGSSGGNNTTITSGGISTTAISGTTGTFTGQLNFSYSGTQHMIVNSTNISGGYIEYQKSGTVYGYVGNAASVLGSGTGLAVVSTGANDMKLGTTGSSSVLMYTNNTLALTIASTQDATFSKDIYTSADMRGLYFAGTRNAILGSNSADEIYINAANATKITVKAANVQFSVPVRSTSYTSISGAASNTIGAGAYVNWINTTTANADMAIQLNASNGLSFWYFRSGGWYNDIAMNPGGAITTLSTVTATAFYESSDIRQKKVHKTVFGLDGIDAIQYTFKPNGTEKWGYSAQQVQKILPFAVTKGNDGFLKLDYTTVHTYKLSEHDTEIFELKKRITQLEKQRRR